MDLSKIIILIQASPNILHRNHHSYQLLPGSGSNWRGFHRREERRTLGQVNEDLEILSFLIIPTQGLERLKRAKLNAAAMKLDQCRSFSLLNFVLYNITNKTLRLSILNTNFQVDGGRGFVC